MSPKRVARRLPGDLYVAAVARAATILGNMVAVTVLLLEFHDRGAGAWAVAGLLATGALPIVLLAPLVGLVVDRFDSRTLMVASSLWQAVTCAMLAFADQPGLVFPLVALNACGAALTNPLFLGLISVLVPHRQLAPANSVQQGAATIAMMAGPAVGGLLIGVTGSARVPLLLSAMVFVGVAGTSLLIGTRRHPGPEEPGHSVGTGVALLFADHVLAAVVTLVVLLTLVVHIIYVAQVFLVRDTFGASGLVFGLLQATHMVGLLIGTVVAGRLTTVRRIVSEVPLWAAMMSAALILIGLVRSLPATFVLYVLMGVCMSMVSISGTTMLLSRVPEPAIGRAMASFTAIHRAAGLIAYGLGGVVVGALPPETVYLLSGTSALAVVVMLIPAFRRAWVLS